jgi:hypothetical protein
MFEVKVYKDAQFAEGAKIALKARLWVIGWQLQQNLRHYSEHPPKNGEIAIGYLDDLPVAVVIHDNDQIMAFCRKALRGNKYASMCLAKLNSKLLKNVYSEEGISGSKIFWHKNGICCY